MTNGTEDDTFRKLRRPSFEDMVRIHNDWWRNPHGNTSLRIPFMIEHGWTWLEFMQTAEQRKKSKQV